MCLGCHDGGEVVREMKSQNGASRPTKTSIQGGPQNSQGGGLPPCKAPGKYNPGSADNKGLWLSLGLYKWETEAQGGKAVS